MGKLLNRLLILWLMPRILIGIIFVPNLQINLFAPFLKSTFTHPLDPWSFWILIGGNPIAFPYGSVMYMVFWPLTLLQNSIYTFNHTEFIITSNLSIYITILVFDYLFSRKLNLFDQTSTWNLLGILSPILIYINYFHGQLDLIPAFFLFLSLDAVKEEKWFKSGLWFALSLSAKFSIALVLPFLIVYFMKDSFRRPKFAKFLLGLIPLTLMLYSPLFWSKGFHLMVLSTPEVLNSLNLAIDVGAFKIMLLPVTYTILLFWFLNLARISSEALLIFTGGSLLAVAGLQVNSIGWFYWGLPLLYLFAAKTKGKILVLLLVWEISVVIWFILVELKSYFVNFTYFRIVVDLLFTTNLIILALIIRSLILRVLRIADRYELIKKPISIAIAGDSGSGKDTLSKGISRLIGENNCNILQGDDYHSYERGDSTWNNITHLNPSANDINLLSRNLSRALDRESFISRHYEHTVGKFTTPRITKPSDFLIVNGLHALLLPNSETIDLRIFLTMNEELRIASKIERDSSLRGHVNIENIRLSIERRRPDYEKFVHPQIDFADLVLKIEPVTWEPLRISFYAQLKDQKLMREIHTTLLSVTNCHSEIIYMENANWLKIQGHEFRKSEGDLLISSMMPSYDQILNSSREFVDGNVGLMAVIALVAATRKRYV